MNTASGDREEDDDASECGDIASLKAALGIRTGQIKRFMVASENGDHDTITIVLTKVSTHDIRSFTSRLSELDGIMDVSLAGKDRDAT